MQTYIFENQSDKEFIPMQTIESEYFGRHFFIDIAFNFLSAPSLKSGGYDKDQLDYVSEWQDFDVADLGKLLDLNRRLCWNQWQEDKDKAHSEMCEYMEAVETGEIQFL
tara:strand:- start:505 stop:831 length:327 start_codon:yes stop_codon:yes gene_type:complete